MMAARHMCRYANPCAQRIATKAEEEGMEVEGFGVARLQAAQAKLAAAGGIGPTRDIKQDNILNLPLPDFDIEGASTWIFCVQVPHECII